MTVLSTKNIQPQKKLFHNQWVEVYPTELPLDSIEYWKENNRTIFTFQRLSRNLKKDISDISIEEITEFIAEQDIHKLEVLSESIKRNGVQVPLIIRSDGKLLDGNRRYFACQWLRIKAKKAKEAEPAALSNIPVFIIRTEDIDHKTELKILAEANFIQDLKVAWPLDAQARAVEDYYNSIIQEKNYDKDTALAEVVSIFGISRQRAIDLLDSLTLTKAFIDEGTDDDDKIRRREIVEEKFVYFWEFLNKAMKGRGAFTNPGELKEVREMFFELIGKGRDTPIKNVKQVEPLVQSRRDETAWSMLNESKGNKLNVVVSIMNDKKELRKAEDQIRVFLAWLKTAENLSSNAKSLLSQVANLATEKSQG
jgi:ParB-like chromosome segregation protein Spo0J